VARQGGMRPDVYQLTHPLGSSRFMPQARMTSTCFWSFGRLTLRGPFVSSYRVLVKVLPSRPRARNGEEVVLAG
jgi:hypothetical protein